MKNPDKLSKVEQRLLDELLAFHAMSHAEPSADTGRRPRLRPGGARPSARPRANNRRRRLSKFQNTAVAAALLAAFAVIIVHPFSSSSIALAVTPEPLAYHTPTVGARSGRQELLSLAVAAARQPAAPAEHARYAYAKTRGWYLDSRIGGRLTTSAVVPSTTESWLAPNGSGRVHRLSKEPDGSRYIDNFRPKGGLPILRLSTDEAVLARQLANGHPLTDGPVEQFVALTDLAERQPIPARVESVILRLLARAPGLINSGSGLINSGSVIDRAGRRGVAVSIDSAYTGLSTRYTWIFDPATGKLLGAETALIGKPGKLNVRSGSVIAYTTILTSGWAASISSRPASTS